MPSPLVAFDPGQSTGVAWISEHGILTKTVKPRHKLALMTSLARTMDSLVDEDTTVVVEQYASRGPNRYGDLTLKIIGGIMMATHAIGCELKFQSPYARKAYLPDATGRNQHERDACAHLLSYMDLSASNGRYFQDGQGKAFGS